MEKPTISRRDLLKSGLALAVSSCISQDQVALPCSIPNKKANPLQDYLYLPDSGVYIAKRLLTVGQVKPTAEKQGFSLSDSNARLCDLWCIQNLSTKRLNDIERLLKNLNSPLPEYKPRIITTDEYNRFMSSIKNNDPESFRETNESFELYYDLKNHYYKASFVNASVFNSRSYNLCDFPFAINLRPVLEKRPDF